MPYSIHLNKAFLIYTEPKVVFGYFDRPVRDDIFVTANFNWRKNRIKLPHLSRSDSIVP
jgi:hypothetical protein